MFYEVFLASFLGAVLGVVGTAFANKILEPSAKLEERRDILRDEFCEKIESLCQLACSYWNEEFEAKSREIIGAETSINASCIDLIRLNYELLGPFDDQRKEVAIDLRMLRKLVTGGNFGDEDPTSDKNRQQDIKVHVAKLVQDVRKYRDKLPRRFI